MKHAANDTTLVLTSEGNVEEDDGIGSLSITVGHADGWLDNQAWR